MRITGASGQAQDSSKLSAKRSVTPAPQRYAWTGSAPSVNQSACSKAPSQNPGLRKIWLQS